MDRSLIFSLVACFALACASDKHEPDCAPTPTPAPSHPEDLADTTEKEAIPNKPSSDDSPAPSTNETPAPTPSAGGAECIIPEKVCDKPEACPGLEQTCHTVGDPIARNDKDAFAKVVAAGSALEKANDPRSAFGCPADKPVKITLSRDCTRCRRMFVSYALECGSVKGLIMVDNNQITSWAKGK